MIKYAQLRCERTKKMIQVYFSLNIKFSFPSHSHSLVDFNLTEQMSKAELMDTCRSKEQVHGSNNFLGTFNAAEIFCSLSQICASTRSVSECCRQCLPPHGLGFALLCIVSCGPYIDRCVCAFPNHVN